MLYTATYVLVHYSSKGIIFPPGLVCFPSRIYLALVLISYVEVYVTITFSSFRF